MRYKEGEQGSRGRGVVQKPPVAIIDLAEQLMNAETSEGLGNNVMQLYQELGEQLWADDVANDHTQQIGQEKASGFMLDKLIELSYIIHREKWRKVRLGGFKQSWAMQPAQNDDLDFERYLTNLKS